jgi:hypothetical protein
MLHSFPCLARRTSANSTRKLGSDLMMRAGDLRRGNRRSRESDDRDHPPLEAQRRPRDLRLASHAGPREPFREPTCQTKRSIDRSRERSCGNALPDSDTVSGRVAIRTTAAKPGRALSGLGGGRGRCQPVPEVLPPVILSDQPAHHLVGLGLIACIVLQFGVPELHLRIAG